MRAEHDFTILGGQYNIAIWAGKVGMVGLTASLIAAGHDGIIANEVIALVHLDG